MRDLEVMNEGNCVRMMDFPKNSPHHRIHLIVAFVDTLWFIPNSYTIQKESVETERLLTANRGVLGVS